MSTSEPKSVGRRFRYACLGGPICDRAPGRRIPTPHLTHRTSRRRGQNVHGQRWDLCPRTGEQSENGFTRARCLLLTADPKLSPRPADKSLCTAVCMNRWRCSMYGRSISMLLLAVVLPLWTNAQTVYPGGIVNGAGFQSPVAPGSVIAIFGNNLAPATAQASALPLPTSLRGVSVTINGTLLAPLFFVSGGQINAQLPYETPVGTATLSVNGS